MRETITKPAELPRPEAQELGRLLEDCPPWGYVDRYSADGWAHIAEGVLRAQERLDARKLPTAVT